ncbi:MAG: hypothetical protein U0174_11075 [Polyangiaceae bacterium]
MMPLFRAVRPFALVFATSLVAAACGTDVAEFNENSQPRSTPTSPGSAKPTEGAAPASSSPPSAASAKPAPYPVVFVHGMAGFENLELGQIGVAYWNGVVADLTTKGESEVFVTETSPYTGSDVRAKELAPQVDAILKKTGRAKVNIIAHSQGGIDARLLASPQGLGYGDRIATITTIATPHRGTRVADVALGIENALPLVADGVTSSLLGFLQKTVYDRDTDIALRSQLFTLSVKGAAEFNAKYTNDARVVYESYAGRSNMKPGFTVCDDGKFANEPLNLDPVTPVLSASASFLEAHFPVEINDGLVPVESAKWGTFLGCVPADHFKEVGHKLLPVGFDHLAFYEKVVARLRSNGF